MADTHKNHIEIDPAQCKGCKLCIEACPQGCIASGTELNDMGYQCVKFENHDCNACGLCYYACPEPGAITVFKKEN